MPWSLRCLLAVAALSCVPAFVAFQPKAISAPQAIVAPRPALHARHRAPVPLSSAAAADLEAAAPQPSGSTGVTPSVINLFKNIVGSGVLALAAGVAAFCGAGGAPTRCGPSAPLPACAMRECDEVRCAGFVLALNALGSGLAARAAAVARHLARRRRQQSSSE